MISGNQSTIQTESTFPKVVFGTSALGNLYRDPGYETKKSVIEHILEHASQPLMFDSAGKYGAGLALESLGQILKDLNVPSNSIAISNKLGWKRVPLKTPEPTFEPGAWQNLAYDAEQHISYDGILECFEQGNELLGDYNASIVSVHDPDEYLALASSDEDRNQRTHHILEAYRALNDLKQAGKVDSIGIGSKDPKTIKAISKYVELDWAMFACALTPYYHPSHVTSLIHQLHQQGVCIINSAVFHGGFLLGGDFFDYQQVSVETHPSLFRWREQFLSLCRDHSVDPAAACVQFSFQFVGVQSVALNTSSPKRVKSNVELAHTKISQAFWDALKTLGNL